MNKKCPAQSAFLNLSAWLWAALVCVVGASAYGNTITITNTNDSGPGSLRQALTSANDGDTIAFAVTGNITLTSGGLLVAKNVTISGPGASQLSVDGNQALLVFGIFPGKTAAISGLGIRNGGTGIWNEQGTLTISNCFVSGNSGGGLYNDHATSNVSNCIVSGNSYGLYNDASNPSASDNLTAPNYNTLSVSNCVISGNSQFGIGNNGILGPLPPVERANHRRGTAKICYFPVGIAPVTVENSIIRDNSGPGVDNNSGTVTIVNSTLTGNHNPAGQDSGYGGGISTYGGKLPGYMSVSNSTISGNSAFYGGGGIASGSYLTIVNSTVSGNSAGDSGGGIATGGPVQITNSTISGNSAANSGGGIASRGHPAEIANTTLSGNSASSGGGIYNVGQYGALEISNTILNAGPLGENIFNNGGTVTSHGYNVSSDNGGGYLTGPGDQINTDPLLGPLQDNGGPTLTHLPLAGSPAIDAGDPNFIPPPLRDQRGRCFYRVFGRRIDVGSVEVQPVPRCPTPAPRPTPAAPP
jgi:predicted outer membrane repeat protein